MVVQVATSVSVRRSFQLVGLARRMMLIIDGCAVGPLWPGRTRTFEIVPGSHVVTIQVGAHLVEQTVTAHVGAVSAWIADYDSEPFADSSRWVTGGEKYRDAVRSQARSTAGMLRLRPTANHAS